MRLKEEQISRLAENILERLTAAGLITVRNERGVLLAAVKTAINADIRAEDDLERDAEKLLEQTLASMKGEGSIDRRLMLRMIKEKLAKERKIVL